MKSVAERIRARDFIIGAIAGALACLLSVFSGCKALTDWPTPVVPPAVAPVVTECKGPVEENFVTLVGDALAGADYESDLSMLVGQTTLCAVRVAVQTLLDRYGQSKALATSPVVQRGRDWLLAHPMRPPGMVSI